MSSGDLRCLCGSLVAKVTKEGIELKCRRCKRVALIPLLKKEQRHLEETHPEVFRYRITFDHPTEIEEGSPQAGPENLDWNKEDSYFGQVRK
jgi:phage FluMu protein Com